MKYHRVVVKLEIKDDRLYNPVEAGETIIHDDFFQWLKNNYPNYIVEIPMNEQEWLQYLSSEVNKSYQKATKLEMICEKLGLDVKLPIAFDQRTASIYSAAVDGCVLNPSDYAGLDDVMYKALSYKEDVEKYEKDFFAKFDAKSITK